MGDKFLIIGGITNKFASVRRLLGEKYFTKHASIDFLDWEQKEIDEVFRYIPEESKRSENLG